VSFKSDLGGVGTDLFLQMGLDDPNHIDPAQQISATARAAGVR
jgi:hypothetical protein